MINIWTLEALLRMHADLTLMRWMACVIRRAKTGDTPVEEART